MGLSSFVYISDVVNLSDARYSAGMGVELLGFNLNPLDEKSINAQQFNEISAWVSGVKIVGEFGDIAAEQVIEILDQFKIDYLLISDESQIIEFSQVDIPLILKTKVNPETTGNLGATLNYCSGSVDYFLFESESIQLNQEEISFIRSYSSQFPIILGYGVNTENAKSVAKELGIKGIALKGSSEIRPGYKDFDELADILEKLEID